MIIIIIIIMVQYIVIVFYFTDKNSVELFEFSIIQTNFATN
jgi:hypothetical protein